MTGKLWWHRSHKWGLELDGQISLHDTVVIHGLTLRTAIANDGAFTALPGGPLAIVEFEAQVVETDPPLPPAIVPANDNNQAEEAT